MVLTLWEFHCLPKPDRWGGGIWRSAPFGNFIIFLICQLNHTRMKNPIITNSLSRNEGWWDPSWSLTRMECFQTETAGIKVKENTNPDNVACSGWRPLTHLRRWSTTGQPCRCVSSEGIKRPMREFTCAKKLWRREPQITARRRIGFAQPVVMASFRTWRRRVRWDLHRRSPPPPSIHDSRVSRAVGRSSPRGSGYGQPREGGRRVVVGRGESRVVRVGAKEIWRWRWTGWVGEKVESVWVISVFSLPVYHRTWGSISFKK